MNEEMNDAFKVNKHHLIGVLYGNTLELFPRLDAWPPDSNVKVIIGVSECGRERRKKEK